MLRISGARRASALSPGALVEVHGDIVMGVVVDLSIHGLFAASLLVALPRLLGEVVSLLIVVLSSTKDIALETVLEAGVGIMLSVI